MKIAIAQIGLTMEPTGELIDEAIESNLKKHIQLVQLATRHRADLVVFPELSLTGYEPTRARELSRSRDDPCFAPLQSLADRLRITIGVGFPLHTNNLPLISTLLLRPKLEPQLRSKRFLHADEEPFFDCGLDTESTIFAAPAAPKALKAPKVSLAICYELSVPQHAQQAFVSGATVYLASVAKTATGVQEASKRLAQLAQSHAAITLLSNCTGVHDGVRCAGQSAAWGRSGQLLARLSADSDGVIVVDYESEDVATDVLAK